MINYIIPFTKGYSLSIKSLSNTSSQARVLALYKALYLDTGSYISTKKIMRNQYSLFILIVKP